MISQLLSIKTHKGNYEVTNHRNYIKQLKNTNTHKKEILQLHTSCSCRKIRSTYEKVSDDISVNKKMYCSWDSQVCPGWADTQTES